VHAHTFLAARRQLEHFEHVFEALDVRSGLTQMLSFPTSDVCVSDRR
jgi:hypothetical protein